MRKQAKPEEQETPIKTHIDELQFKRQVAEALKPLHLTEKALVLISDGKALVLTEKAARQLEEFGRMSLDAEGRKVYELDVMCVGRMMNDRVSFVDEIILPSRDKVLVIKDGSNFSVSRFLTSKMSKEGYSKLEPFIRKGERVVSLLLKLTDSKGEDECHVQLLKTLENLGEFPRIFADSSMSFDKLMKKDWEAIIVAGDTYILTEQYADRLKRAPGSLVFDVHIHPLEKGEEPDISASDIFKLVVKHQSVEWFGFLHVRPTKPEEFKFNRDDLLTFYSGIEDVSWIRKSLPLFKKYLRKDQLAFDSFAASFKEKQKAEVLTYGELLKELG
jgi:hypothetical protein